MTGTSTTGARRAEKPGDAVIDTGTGSRGAEPTKLRDGLESPPDDGAPAQFSIEPRAMGAKPEFALDDVHGLLERLDGPGYR